VVGLLVRFALCAATVWAATAPVVFTQAPRYTPSALERFPNGAALHIYANGKDTVLVAGFAASADASVSFDGHRVLFSGKARPGDRWQIWEVPLSGGTPRRVIATTDDCITPFYLPADRIVFARRTAAGYQLQTAPLPGGAPVPLTYAPGRPIVDDVLRDGRVLFEDAHASGARELYTVYTDGSGVETHRCNHGQDRRAAREIASGDIVFENAGRLARFTSARAVEVPIEMPRGEFAGPVAEVAPGEWIVSFRPSAQAPYKLVRWTGSNVAPVLAASENLLQPAIVQPRTRPKMHPSALGNREGANTLCLNVYTSKLRIPESSVAAVRVWAQDNHGSAIALGQAPVEADGSFYVQTPADRPIRFELLDSSGKTVAAEKGWFWMRRGEQRVCVGCHAGPERAPDNVSPLILTRSTEPTKMGVTQ
jgi:hypothetical protein